MTEDPSNTAFGMSTETSLARDRNASPCAGEAQALLIAGDGDGWAIPVRGGPDRAAVICVTMIAGVPREMFDIPYGSVLWKRAAGTWLRYGRIDGLPPDGLGRVGYWYLGRWEPGEDALLAAQMRRHRWCIEDRLAAAGDGRHWPVLEAMLTAMGHRLILSGPETCPPP